MEVEFYTVIPYHWWGRGDCSTCVVPSLCWADLGHCCYCLLLNWESWSSSPGWPGNISFECPSTQPKRRQSQGMIISFVSFKSCDTINNIYINVSLLALTSMIVSCLGAKFFSTSSLSLRNIIGFKMACSFWTCGPKKQISGIWINCAAVQDKQH